MCVFLFVKLNLLQCDAAVDSDVVDIDKLLPINSSSDAILFCDDHDGLFHARKKVLLKRIYGAWDVSGMAAFVASVADILFSMNYQISHRWPSKQYV